MTVMFGEEVMSFQHCVKVVCYRDVVAGLLNEVMVNADQKKEFDKLGSKQLYILV